MGQVSGYRIAIAARYWHAAKLVLDHQARPVEHMEPVGYLLAMAAEIAIKTFLTDRGWDDRRLAKRIGHDLREGIRQAIHEGFLVSDLEVGCVLSMREAHMNHFNRYGMPSTEGKLQLGAVLITDEGRALECAAMLIDRVSGDPQLLRKRYEHPAPVPWPLTMPVERPVSLQRLEEINRYAQAEHQRIRAINAGFRKQFPQANIL